MNIKIDDNEVCHQIIQECFRQINEFRMFHGVKPLVYEHYLEKSAQETANKLSRIEGLELCELVDYKYGELTGKLENAVCNLTGIQIAATWYATGDQYIYSLEEPVSETKSFTQLIWAASEEIGLGIKVNAKGDVYFVGHFVPRGNICGKFHLNVFPCQIQFQNLNLSLHEMNRIAVERVNYYRSKHNSPPLYIALDLIKSAGDRAAILAHLKEIKPNSNALCGIAENACLIQGVNGPLKFEDTIDEWYDCGRLYDYLFESASPSTDCFTQLIWKETRQVGFNMEYFNGNYIFVAHFQPIGNIPERFHENVQRTKKIPVQIKHPRPNFIDINQTCI